MHDVRVARRYAQALFSTALKYEITGPVEEDLRGIKNLIENDKGFKDFLIAPYASRDEKAKILDRLFSDRVTALTMQVLRVMLEKAREGEIPYVFDEYVRLRREHEQILFVKVTSAEVMEESQRQRLIEKLTGVIMKNLEAQFEVDPHLIGGVRVEYENYVLDGSVRGTLNKLRERLRYDLLKQV